MKVVTILFLRKGDQILLAMKKRGFGAGRWNGVGGKADIGETPEEAAVRECQEEIGVTPTNFDFRGDIAYSMVHDPSFGHHAHIFLATEWEGEPTETEEMRPQWFDVHDIPYDEMWPNDRTWLPKVLVGKRIHASIRTGLHDEIVEASIEES